MNLPARAGVMAVSMLIAAGPASAAVQLYVPEYADDLVDVFNYGSDGALTPITGSPFSSGTGGTIGFGITPDGKRAVAALLVGTTVSGFAIEANGALSPPKDAPGLRTYRPAMSPDNVHAYFPSDEATDPGVLAYTLTPLGQPAGVGDEAFGDTQAIGVAITPDARFLYAIGIAGIQRFGVEADGSLTSLGVTPACGGPTTVKITPDGRFLLLVCTQDDTVVVFSIGADGALAPVGAPTPLPALDDGLAEISPDGRFLYVPVDITDTVVTFSIGVDGSLIPVGEPADAGTDGGVTSVAVSPDGRFLFAREQGSTTGDLTTMSIGADGRPTLLPGVINVPGGEPVAPLFRPVQPPVARVEVASAAPGRSARFDAAGSTDPDGSVARWDWDFGDGTNALDAGATPAHAYAAAGVYTATVTVTDDLGCSIRFVHQGQHAYCNGGPSARATVAVDTLPAITALSLQRRRFATAAAKRKAKRGSAFRYRVTEAAKVRFTVERKLGGRKVGKKCRPKTRKNRGRKRCTRFKRAGGLTAAGKAGSNRTRFSGKLRGRKLKPGRYRATAVATDLAGGKSAPKSVGFRIVR